MKPKPIIQAILLCECVYVDSNGRAVIAGTFDRFDVHRTPWIWDRSCYVYISMTEIYKEASITLRFIDLENHDVLLESGPYHFTTPSPLDTMSIGIPISGFSGPRPGSYLFEPYLGQESLGASYRIRVNQIN